MCELFFKKPLPISTLSIPCIYPKGDSRSPICFACGAFPNPLSISKCSAVSRKQLCDPDAFRWLRTRLVHFQVALTKPSAHQLQCQELLFPPLEAILKHRPWRVGCMQRFSWLALGPSSEAERMSVLFSLPSWHLTTFCQVTCLTAVLGCLFPSDRPD